MSMYWDSEDYWFLGAMIFMGVLLVGLVWLAVIEADQWSGYAKMHECKEMGRSSASTAVGPNMGGNGGVAVVIIPGKTRYVCNDGKEYWR